MYHIVNSRKRVSIKVCALIDGLCKVSFCADSMGLSPQPLVHAKAMN